MVDLKGREITFFCGLDGDLMRLNGAKCLSWTALLGRVAASVIRKTSLSLVPSASPVICELAACG